MCDKCGINNNFGMVIAISYCEETNENHCTWCCKAHKAMAQANE